MRREEWWSDEMTAEQKQHFYTIRAHQLGQYRLAGHYRIYATGGKT